MMVRKGVFELRGREGPLPERRVRRSGGGRMRAEVVDPQLVPAFTALVGPDERGDPMSPLRWTTKSLRNLAIELSRRVLVSPGAQPGDQEGVGGGSGAFVVSVCV
ncbi:hypothetical protein GT354_39665 [Streptomyces sp. SID3343]|nr:hypothetical protein [Streptomyces sp. SID3343]